MTSPAALDRLVDAAQRDLEAALHGASLCRASRDPSAGATTVKFLEGRWYTLRDVQRRLDVNDADPLGALEAAEVETRRRTPSGSAWQDYADGARSALAEARSLLSDQPPG